MISSAPILPPEWQGRTHASLSWLRRSIEATGAQGSSHSWHPLFGWSKAYPETSGYLIETLLAYHEIYPDDGWKETALSLARWLDSVQLPSGAYPGLLAGNRHPSVFNTSQILFASPQLKGAGEALDWILSVLEPDGSWKQAAFVPGFVPTYYTRAIWGVLLAAEALNRSDIPPRMLHSLSYYEPRFLLNGMLRNAGFRPGAPAFTHTLAYALEGFWECGRRLSTSSVLNKTLESLERLLLVRSQNGGRTAGSYREDWTGDYRFQCITGNCQLSHLYQKVGMATGESRFLQASLEILQEILPYQRLGANKNTFGAFPGSAPLWGAYLPFRYPNWTQKFFLDAMLAHQS